MKNFYQILGVPTDATNEEIRIAYRKLATKLDQAQKLGTRQKV
ncbi:DnaJ domain-containing protein [Chryseobacterium bernardetii]